MKSVYSIFFFVLLTTCLSFCTSDQVSKEDIAGIENAGKKSDELAGTYKQLKNEFRAMVAMLQVLPEDAKKTIPNYDQFQSEVFGYRDKMVVYDDDLSEISNLGKVFAEEVKQGKYSKESAAEKFKYTNQQILNIEKNVDAFNKELTRLSGPYNKILQTLPNGGKDLLGSKSVQTK